ncbi:NAD(P)H-hydrate dehydratase [Alsobacter sp. SYSU M60028]|uniref:Bifunctional NAD(P)H-hydrate repair enzyme n=1 Tax=Alsobacter ponti TaxID=2962936 RepID=A0ABT1LAM3_9HYPH|nr:NAD(P)H-hydrate dehydratase [Alsobacter ponti]MCP8938499.1 NAD(P)H-hydrate dehydratase [Alsobacter ponti]
MNEVLSTAQMGEADRLAIAAGTPGSELMDKAGRAVADVVARRHKAGERVLALCGPGNNGGDGFVAARVLAGRGFRVRVALLGAREALRGDAAGAAALWSGAVEPASAADPAECDVIVDALFGAGLARDLDGEALALVERVNASGVPVVAVDVPSGVDGNTGAVRRAAIRAAETVTFFRPKPGHLLLPGRLRCGPVRIADIGIPDAVLATIRPACWANGTRLWRPAFRAPAPEGHKYGRGHALVLSGGAEGAGAARLAARGALRIGAGLVTIATPSDALALHAGRPDAVMLRRSDGPAGLAALLADRRRNAWVVGPAAGVGERTRELVAAALASGAHGVLDADALTSFEGASAELARALAARPGGAGQAIVLTPHEGEFGRLFKDSPPVASAGSKLERARAAAASLGAVVVLKGPDTVIAAPDGRAAINANGTPFLATAGSGDVLSGIVAGLLAQSVPAFEAACAGVWFHAEAGCAVGPGLIADDLPDALPKVLKAYFAEAGT